TKDSPYAPLVSSRNIGLVVEDMNELDKKMAILTENEYKKMLEAVRPWQEAVSEGFFTKHALVNLTRGMELGYEDVIYKESKQADYSEFIEQLTQKIFYFMHHDNSEKKDYLKFLPDGKIESLDNVSANNWEIGNDKLYILDEYKGLSSIFDIREGFNAMLRGRYLKEDIPALLVETDMEELEFIEVDPDKDKGDLSTFVEKDSEEYKKLKAIAQEGKTVDGYGNGKYVVIPNEKIFYINDMIKDEELGLWYHFEEPRHQDEELCKKLIVYMPTFNAISSTSAHARFFGAGWFGSLGGYAPANTHIMRISENNLISGSYMMDTKNNPNYEEQIQSLIKKVAKQHEIPETNIVLMGNSRGGTIALLHGLIGNYSVMSSDPIVNRGEWLADDKDEQMILDAIPEDFTVRLNKLLKNTKIAKENIKIFTQEKIQITYPYIEKLNQDKFELIKYDSEFFGEDDTMNGRNRHGYFIQNTLPVQRDTVYTILNSFDPKKPEEEMEEK
ncbi:MAG: XcbB/CpsF family capsular polysaccharide biosynthesis protein, partial [Streptococcaceae bacterium]|nr:XcbB/CpsF family capsular polysaccharide biosynthesis protein [Streptococcaceae bacterium]MCL2681680.1 XcbB/CpsF family capsular polysaccharide biosynthesis protein [Streptococcaceae bacterium]